MRLTHIILSKLHQKLEVHEMSLWIFLNYAIEIFNKLKHDFFFSHQFMRDAHSLKSLTCTFYCTFHQSIEELEKDLCIGGYDYLEIRCSELHWGWALLDIIHWIYLLQCFDDDWTEFQSRRLSMRSRTLTVSVLFLRCKPFRCGIKNFKTSSDIVHE